MIRIKINFSQVISDIQGILFGAWVSFGDRVFGWHFIDVYAPGKNPKKKVVGITFSTSKKYIDKIANVK